jgi:transcription antitermination factor NusG
MLTDDQIEQIKRRALEITAEIEARTGPFHAEVVPGISPQWHLVETLAGQEFKAVKFLVDRQFGVFLPTFDGYVNRKLHGVDMCGGRKLIFPGHVFVFVWDIALHWRRIMSCPGVGAILLERPEQPVVVPDKVIDKIQALQFGFFEPTISRRKRAKLKHQGKQHGNENITLTCPSRWQDMPALAPDQRIGLLRRALGLETLTPSGAEATMPS